LNSGRIWIEDFLCFLFDVIFWAFPCARKRIAYKFISRVMHPELSKCRRGLSIVQSIVMGKDLIPYQKKFSVSRFWIFVKRKAGRTGQQIIYAALLLYYAYHRKETPRWAKMVIAGALGYLLAPIDGIPDMTPIIGYTDDLGVLSFALVTIAGYVNQDVKMEAKTRLKKWFDSVDENSLMQIDDRL